MTKYTHVDDRAHALSDVLAFASAETKHWIIDEVYCALFNLAGSLEGISAAGDVEWFAQLLYQENSRIVDPSFEMLNPIDRKRWLDLAESATGLLPRLMGRQATRLREYTRALNTLLLAARNEVEGRGR